MPTNPPDDPLRGGALLPLGGADLEGEATGLAALLRQREAFSGDVRRIEAALAQGGEGSPGLYERLLRSRRISDKLENRILIVRLQQSLRTGT